MVKYAIFAGAVLLLATEAASANDVVTLRCDFPEQDGVHAHWDDIIADQNGISITSYCQNSDGTTGYVNVYTTNKKKIMINNTI